MHSIWILKLPSMKVLQTENVRWVILCERCGLFWFGTMPYDAQCYVNRMAYDCWHSGCEETELATRSHQIHHYQEGCEEKELDGFQFKIQNGFCLDCGARIADFTCKHGQLGFHVVLDLEANKKCSVRRMTKALG